MLSLPTAQKAYDLLKAGVIRGTSIGYDTIKTAAGPKNNTRLLQELRLWECSIVTFPMNESAGIMDVKQVEGMLRGIART